MANAEHEQDAREAIQDIKDDGQAATLFVRNPDVAPAWDPDYSAETGTTIYLVRFEEETSYGDDMTVKHMKKVMIAQSPASLFISLGDDIVIDGLRLTVTLIKPFAPAGSIIYWDAEIGN